MVFKVNSLCLIVFACLVIEGTFHTSDYEFKELPTISKGFKKLGMLLLKDDKDFKHENIGDELINDLLTSLEICQRGLDEAAIKVESLLDLISPDEFSEVKASEEVLHEDLEDNLYEHIEFKLIEEDLSDIEAINKREKDTHKELYVKDLEKLLQTFNHACSTLPKSLPIITNRRVRSPQQVAKRLALSLKKWAEKWLGRIEHKLDTFLVNCLKNEECEQYLQKMVKLFIEILKENKHNLDENTISILAELQRSPYKGNPSIENLSDIQRIALTMGDPLDAFEEDDEVYQIAEAVNGIEDQNYLKGSEEGVNTLGLISNLLQFRSFEKLKKAAAIIEIEEDILVTNLPPTFLSLAFGSSIIQEGWGEVRSQKEKFIKIASALSPSILRVGGSAANFLTYDPSSTDDSLNKPTKSIQHNQFIKKKHPKIKTNTHQKPKSDYMINNLIPKTKSHPKRDKRTQYAIETNKIDSLNFFEQQFDVNELCQPQMTVEKNYKNFTMTGDDWTFLVELIKDLKWDLVFDLNQFWRDPHGHWDPTNAKLIINDPKSSTIPIIWQLGNEPNSYKHKFNFSINPEEAAKDYRLLAEVTEEASNSREKASIIGPDVTRPRHLEEELTEDSMNYLRKFLEGNPNIDVLTWHQYYIDGKTATLENFLSTEILNAFPLELQKIVDIKDLYAPGKPIWITETASAWGGGAPGLSNRFVGCFPWLDKLGAAALGGASNVFRQTLYGGCYSLLDNQLQPYPDFWVSVLHKHIVGEGVLLPRVRLANNSTRIYAHCLNQKHHMFQKGAIVIFGINLAGETERLKVMGEKFKKSAKFLYELSAPQGDLRSRDILLNGKILKISDEGNLPEFIAVKILDEDLLMAPYSLNFWVFPDAGVQVC